MDKLKIVPPENADSILVAVSGGADSVALLALLREAAAARPLRLTAAHFEHGIRAEASLADAAFVRTLCDRWSIPLIEGSADVPELARQRSVGLEEAARDARYAFLRNARQEAGADLIALAHHRDDQVETVMMHLMRGAGLRGLAGMKELEGALYRPLLRFPKETLVAYLQEEGIPWREDATNSVADNPRNGLRLDVLPQIERFYPGARRAICRFAEIASVEDDYMEEECGRFLASRAVELPFGWLVRLGNAHRAIAMRALHRLTGLTHESVKRAVGLWKAGGGALQLEGGWRAEKGRLGLYLIREKRCGLAEQALPEEGVVSLYENAGRLRISEGTGMPVLGDRFSQELDADALRGAVVRTRQNGDTIYPLGAPGRQRLSDYFINRHVDRPLRDVIPLIAKGKSILWVMGEGISEEAKLKDGSRAVRLELADWPLQKVGGYDNA